MGSKTFVFLGLLLATLFLIASEVTARDLVGASTSQETTEQTNNGVVDAKYGGGGGCYGRGCYGGGGGGGCYGRGCYGGGGGGGCRYGCCGRGYYGCRRCCEYEGEPVDNEG